jgi:hypothetical protein
MQLGQVENLVYLAYVPASPRFTPGNKRSVKFVYVLFTRAFIAFANSAPLRSEVLAVRRHSHSYLQTRDDYTGG